MVKKNKLILDENFKQLLEAFASELFLPLQKNHLKFRCRKTHLVTFTCDSAHVKFHV